MLTSGGANQLRNVGAEGVGSRKEAENFLGRDETPREGSGEAKCFLCWHRGCQIPGQKQSDRLNLLQLPPRLPR